ncbi:PAS domain-containing protein [Flavobacterium hydrophilum]|uniref:histidine kinase n=1 Tax=Flavobacterium hydrophilum TaxID=2211445 RepID=A0A2V4C7E4_9FLAO|nr:PAS domain S-box protein [Flavobacterium hydrophilum]PXY46003.1 hypothetical protein DMB68_02110 [Flavobacterium hydrophilum]
MQKKSITCRILLMGNVQDVNNIKELLHDRIIAPKITATYDFKIGFDMILSFKYDIILININHIEDIEILDSIEKNISDAGVIIISDIPSISEIIDLKNTNKSSIVFDYLPKTELTSFLILKSITYINEINKNHIKLKSLQRKYNNLFEMNPVPMWIYDLEFLKFWRVNTAAVRKYGYTKDEFKKMTIRDIRPREDIEKLEKAVGLVRKHKMLFSNGIYRHKKKDGTIIYVELISNIIYIDKVKYVLVLANDITETLDYIQAIESQNSKLQEIAFSHSHLIRAPLTNIMGILNLIREIEFNNPESAELLEHLSTSCNQLDEKISEIVEKSAPYPLPENKV